MRIYITVLFLTLFLSTPALAQLPRIDSIASSNDCLKYDSILTLSGKIITITYPGPPHWKSIKKRDKPIKVWVLHLDKPICVDFGFGSKEKNVIDIQLVPDGETDNEDKILKTQLKKYARSHKAATQIGSLFHAFNSYDFTAVLMYVTELK